MKIRPLHKDLDTGFVSLPGLLRYLRQKDFVGLVRIDLKEYRAEIIFEESRRVRMREFNARTGRLPESPGALQHLLDRAQEPGGTVSVYEAVKPARKSVEEELDDILDLGGNAAVKNKPGKDKPANIKPQPKSQ